MALWPWKPRSRCGRGSSHPGQLDGVPSGVSWCLERRTGRKPAPYDQGGSRRGSHKRLWGWKKSASFCLASANTWNGFLCEVDPSTRYSRTRSSRPYLYNTHNIHVHIWTRIDTAQQYTQSFIHTAHRHEHSLTVTSPLSSLSKHVCSGTPVALQGPARCPLMVTPPPVLSQPHRLPCASFFKALF